MVKKCPPGVICIENMTIFMIIILLAGYKYITAGGDESEIQSAKKTIGAAIAGLLLIMLSYSITIFVTKGVQQSLRPDKEILGRP
mgnify:CR=1 FL=1